MSNPYQFNPESSRSPLDRQPPNLFPAGQPPSFKTNVNRMKTKKWVEAKPTSYDGGDWGDYDEYDEYGAEQEAQPPASTAAPTGFRQPGQSVATSGRSFTDPQQGRTLPQVGRRNSFEAGEEQMAFSTAAPRPGPAEGYGQTMSPISPSGHPGPQETLPLRPVNRQASGAQSDSSDTPQNRRDFTPTALPHPLQTRVSPAPGPATAPPAAKFPARKSSLSQADSPAGAQASPTVPPPRERAPSNPSKPLPFIRPADIYKRVEEERQRERASLDSSRPSLDSLTSRPTEESASPRALAESGGAENMNRSSETGRSLQPLATVAERKSEYLPDFDVTSQSSQPTPQAVNAPIAPTTSPGLSLPLPQVQRISSFDDFWSTGPEQQPATDKFANSPGQDTGIRSVVEQAFTRVDDGRSVPPTPISKQSDSGVSRSNTDSTAGISPIMSRVPSSAVSNIKTRNAEGQTTTPAISEETGGTTTPVPQPMLRSSFQIQRKPSPAHSRNASATSIPQADLTPSAHESPARSPAIEAQKPLPGPAAADISALNPESPEMEGGLGGQSPEYASREADIAAAMKSSPEAVPELGAAEKASQAAFLESHQSPPPHLPEPAAQSRPGSPSKGRVQELASKFGEVSNSRRGSLQSNASRTSIQSWERSHDNSRPSSPTKANPRGSRPGSVLIDAPGGSVANDVPGDRPSVERESTQASFRPKLPGQWESFVTTPPTPSEPERNNDNLGHESANAAESPRSGSPLEAVDLTPTTAKQPLAIPELPEAGDSILPKSLSEPFAAVKEAGTAVGEAIKASVGLGSSTENDTPEFGERARGDLYLRPLTLDRTASSAPSSIPPTPPAKDTPESEDLPPPPPLKERSPEPESPTSKLRTPSRPIVLPQLSSEPSIHDQESDRLRKEIVATLTAFEPPKAPTTDVPDNALQPTQASTDNRESSVFPAEYDSYWADGGEASPPRQSEDISKMSAEQPRASLDKAQSPETSAGALPPSVHFQPQLLNRFSWEPAPLRQTPASQAIEVGVPGPVPPKDVPDVPENRTVLLHQAEEALDSQSSRIPESSSKAEIEPSSELLKPATTTPERGTEKPSPTPGLHVVNDDLNPEAVDMPARLSMEAPGPRQPPEEQKAPGIPESDAAPISKPALVQATAPQPVPNPKPVVNEKPLGFREIFALNSPAERIATYNRTRDHWASVDYGLNEWITSAMSSNPNIVSQPLANPEMAASAAARHKHTPSISLFGRHHHGSVSAAQGNHSLEQYPTSSSQRPSTPTQSSAAPEAMSSTGGRSASHVGKDILHTAGILGGKGMTSAKGLFAKGKSRFRASGGGDKASTSSREASEEPELIPTTEKRAVEPDSSEVKDEKRKRRFSLSSAFHRPSRSRSRPSSIVLPKSQHFDFAATSVSSKNTPSREGSRPHSFHAPDSWNVHDDAHRAGDFGSLPLQTGLRPPDRLGVLPSPAKSAFSLLQPDKEEDIPPVPPLPERMEPGPAPAQRVLQSVMRHSTPPGSELAKELAKLQDALLAESSKEMEEDSAVTTETGRALQDTDQQETTDEAGDDAKTYPAVSADESGPFHLPTIPQSPAEAPALLISAPTKTPDTDKNDSWTTDRSSSERIQTDTPSRLDLPPLRLKPDVSPMLTPVKLGPISTKATRQNPMDGREDLGAQRGRAYETELIGAGDVSPISAHNSDEEKLPTSTREVHTPVPAILAPDDVETAPIAGAEPSQPRLVAPEMDTEHLAPVSSTAAPKEKAGASSPHLNPTSRPRVIPSSYKVVHAVQYVASHSSMESWEQDSIAAPSQSEGSQLGDRPDSPTLPPPETFPVHVVKQSGEGHGVPKQAGSRSESFPPEPGATQETRPVQPDRNSQQRSTEGQSLIDVISAAVSVDGDLTAPNSAKSHQSLPSSAHRPPRPPPVNSSSIPVQPNNAPEPTEKPSGSPQTDDGFDLYADHNGIVKDVQDKRTGQPLRIGDGRFPRPVYGPPVEQPGKEPMQLQVASATDDASTRGSFERPMSFISGSRDANSIPQDRINWSRPAPTEKNLPPLPPLSSYGQEHSPSRSVDPKLHTMQNSEGPPMPNERRPLQPPSETFTGREKDEPAPPLPPLSLSQQPLLPGQAAQAPHQNGSASASDARVQYLATHDARPAQDPRLRGMFPGQPFPFPHDPRAPQSRGPHAPPAAPPGAGYGAPPAAAPPPPPRNEYEAQQRMMRQQAMDPRLRGTEFQLPGVGPPQSLPHPGNNNNMHAPNQEEKPPAPASAPAPSASRPMLSVFKSLGSRASPSSPHSSSQASSRRIPPNLTAPDDQLRSFSYQSSLGDLPSEQQQQQQQLQVNGRKKDRKTSIFSSHSKRPESVGTESFLSHDSTRAQAPGSRIDLKYPSSPPPNQGIPPGALDALQEPGPHRSSTSGVPQTVKKKRFSALGALFGRTTGHKLTKEEKKTQKAQKHGSLPIMPQPVLQRPAAQQWPPPQYGRPPQGVMTGQPGPAPGIQVRPNQMLPQPHAPAQAVYQPQHLSPLGPNGSAFQEASRARQAAEPRRVVFSPPAQAQRSPNVEATPSPPVRSFGHTVQRVEAGGDPSLAGYYAPDTKRWSRGHGAAGFAAIAQLQQTVTQQTAQQTAQQQAQQRHSYQRRISSQPPIDPSTMASPISQRNVSAPLNEPRYETPQIPAAYARVGGVSQPASQQPTYETFQAARPPHGQTPSDPQVWNPQPPPQQHEAGARPQFPDPGFQPTPPQMDGQPQRLPHPRTYSESSSASMVSPISNPSPGMAASQPTAVQRPPQTTMGSISERTQHERPWHLDLPEGATEQEIVRARHQQYMQQLAEHQARQEQQLQAARSAHSTSPHAAAPRTRSSSPPPPTGARSEGRRASTLQGFHEVQPRSSPQPFPLGQPHVAATSHGVPSHSSTPQLQQPQPQHIHEGQMNPISPAAYPLPMSPAASAARSPVNPIANSLPPPPPPKIPHSPIAHGNSGNPAASSQQEQAVNLRYPSQTPTGQELTDHPRAPYQLSPSEQPGTHSRRPRHQVPPHQEHALPPENDPPPTDDPPPYSGPSIPYEPSGKADPVQFPPPFIPTSQAPNHQIRPRQPSLGLLQHPQPASMAASPQRSPADMGADILRRQLLEQEQMERLERIQRAEVQRAQSQREAEERERARARARELERSVSGGGRVSSLRSATGSGSGRGSSWGGDRRGSHAPGTTLVFELPAEEDDEPVMRGVSYPGQEWTPDWDGE